MTLSRKIAELIVGKNLHVDDAIEKLREYGLMPLLPSIMDAVIKITRDQGSAETLRVESPFPLDATALARIRRIVGNDLAETEVTINKSILAGFKARFKGKLYDGSAERIIKQLTH
jgi:F0F1-type ATP synthase delta subunit